ncbi:hypothetical protein B0H14DRAFT_2191139, partial [Mycena olivaceomarginata]
GMNAEQQAEIERMQAAIHYEGKGPCYKCYISSNGRNTLHPQFKPGVPCPHRYLALPLAYAVWSDPALRAAAEAELMPEGAAAWSTIRGFGEWF